MPKRLSLVPASHVYAPPAPVLTVGALCSCRCHRPPDLELPADDGHHGVPRESTLEAAVACPCCRRLHCPALSGRPAELGPARPWNPPPLKPALPEPPEPAYTT